MPPPADGAPENANPAWKTIPLTDGRKDDPQLDVEGKIDPEHSKWTSGWSMLLQETPRRAPNDAKVPPTDPK